MPTRSPVLICCVLAGVMALLGLTATRGRTEPESSPSLLLASGGTIELSNSLNGAAVLTARNMKPGGSAAGTVSVSNTSSVDGDFSLSQANLVDTPGPLGGQLSNRVQLSVEAISNAGSTAQSLYSGVLSGLGTQALGTLRAGETRSYRFTVAFPEGGAGDNQFQSASVSVDYVWKAIGAGSGGGGGGGGAGGGGAGEPSLTLTLSGKRKQRALRKRRLVVRAQCSVACRLTPTARVKKVRGVRRLRALRSPLAAGTPRRVVFKISRKQARILRRVLRRHKRVVAVVKVTATASGARVTATRRIRLRR